MAHSNHHIHFTVIELRERRSGFQSVTYWLCILRLVGSVPAGYLSTCQGTWDDRVRISIFKGMETVGDIIIAVIELSLEGW